MKAGLISSLIALSILVLCGVTLAQSSFEFRNLRTSAGIDAPVFDATGIPLSGTNYLAVLYGGLVPDVLQLAVDYSFWQPMTPVPFQTGTLAGYFLGSSVIAASEYPGGFAWLQVRAWEAALGATYEEAVARGQGGYGESPLRGISQAVRWPVRIGCRAWPPGRSPWLRPRPPSRPRRRSSCPC